jgi:hypothetical protein
MPFKIWGENESLKAADANAYWLQSDWVRKTADESVTSSTTLQNDNELFLPLLANTQYWFETFIIYDGHLDGGLRLSPSIPAGATIQWTHGGLRASAGATVGEVSRTAFTDTINPGQIGCVTGSTTVVVGEGRVTTSGTAGNFQLQWAQITSHATATRVLTDSAILLTRLTE